MLVIGEEWFDGINVTDSANFPLALIKRAKFRFNQKQFTWNKTIHL